MQNNSNFNTNGNFPNQNDDFGNQSNNSNPYDSQWSSSLDENDDYDSQDGQQFNSDLGDNGLGNDNGLGGNNLNQGQEQFDNRQQDQFGQTNQKVKPVKASVVTTTVILIVAVIVFMIIVITMRGCTVEKKVTGGTQQNQVTETAKPRVTVRGNKVEMESASPEASETPEVSATPEATEETNTDNSNNIINNNNVNNGSTVTQDSNGGYEVSPITNPVFATSGESTGLVLDKSAYLINGSYTYGLKLSLIYGDQNKTAMYFCPKKTYDAVADGDPIKVSYDLDSNGIISITTLSKATAN